MKAFLITLLLFPFALITQAVLAGQQQQHFMAPDEHGDIWSLCNNPSTHQLIGYKDGVYISPKQPKTGENIHVQVKGNLLKDVTSGKVDIDLNLMGMIKIRKQLDLCDVLNSDIMGHKDCPLNAGDLELDATAWIPKELPRLPLDGNIQISDQDGKTVTCIHLNFKLE